MRGRIRPSRMNGWVGFTQFRGFGFSNSTVNLTGNGTRISPESFTIYELN